MSSNNIYYVYAYLRSKDSKTAKAGTPYYIGKGKENRAWSKQHTINLPTDISMIVLLETGLTDIGALALERRLIRWWGRKDLNSGILRNLTDGGEGGSGRVATAQERSRASAAKKGREFSKEHCTALSNAQKGKTPWNKGVKGAQQAWNKGAKFPNSQSEETKRKRSASLLGRKRSDEIKRKISETKQRKKLLGSYLF